MKKFLSITLISLMLFAFDALGGWSGGGSSSLLNGPITITGTKTITSDESINITSYYSGLKTDTVVAGAVTVDFDDSNSHYIVLGNGANTITLANPESGANYKIYLKQPASGAAGTVTFSPVPRWPSGVAPTLTVTNAAMDIVYLGYEGTISMYDADINLDVK